MRRSENLHLPNYFELYIHLVPEININEAFEKSIGQLFTINKCKWNMIGNRTYADGKWTIKEILQHISDMERIFSCHVLLMSRNVVSPIYKFDTEIFVKNSNANNRSIAELLTEILSIRKSTYSLFKSFSQAVLNLKPLKEAPELTLRAIGFNIIGHQLHHFHIIETLYYPLVSMPEKNGLLMSCNPN